VIWEILLEPTLRSTVGLKQLLAVLFHVNSAYRWSAPVEHWSEAFEQFILSAPDAITIRHPANEEVLRVQVVLSAKRIDGPSARVVTSLFCEKPKHVCY
jgi:hypothetical protein